MDCEGSKTHGSTDIRSRIAFDDLLKQGPGKFSDVMNYEVNYAVRSRLSRRHRVESLYADLS